MWRLPIDNQCSIDQSCNKHIWPARSIRTVLYPGCNSIRLWTETGGGHGESYGSGSLSCGAAAAGDSSVTFGCCFCGGILTVGLHGSLQMCVGVFFLYKDDKRSGGMRCVYCWGGGEVCGHGQVVFQPLGPASVSSSGCIWRNTLLCYTQKGNVDFSTEFMSDLLFF